MLITESADKAPDAVLLAETDNKTVVPDFEYWRANIRNGLPGMVMI